MRLIVLSLGRTSPRSISLIPVGSPLIRPASSARESPRFVRYSLIFIPNANGFAAPFPFVMAREDRGRGRVKATLEILGVDTRLPGR